MFTGLKYEGENESDLKDQQDFSKQDPSHYPAGGKSHVQLYVAVGDVGLQYNKLFSLENGKTNICVSAYYLAVVINTIY